MSNKRELHDPNQSPKRPRRKVRYIFVLIAGMLIAMALCVVYPFFGTSQLKQELALMQEQGLPTNAVELNAFYAVPPDIADTTKLWTAATATARNGSIGYLAKKLPLVGQGITPIPDPGTEWPEFEASQSFLKEREGLMQKLRRAAEAGGMARYPVDFSAGIATLLPDAQEARTLARLLELSVHVNAHEGQQLAVLQDAIAILRLSDSLRGEPTLISQVQRIATHGIGCELVHNLLRHGNFMDEDLEELQLAIGLADFREEMINAVRGENAIFFITIDTQPNIWFRDANKLKAIELYSESVDALRSSWQDARTKGEEIAQEVTTKATSKITQLKENYIRHLFPALTQSATAGARAEARQNCLIAEIAAYRYQLAHGLFPASLADLREFIPGDEVTATQRLTDPFNGQPLRFKSDRGTIVIYSVSGNGIDDGGEISNDTSREGDHGYLIKIP